MNHCSKNTLLSIVVNQNYLLLEKKSIPALFYFIPNHATLLYLFYFLLA
jgi:hypothetical protein